MLGGWGKMGRFLWTYMSICMKNKQLNVLKGGRQFLENRQSSLLAAPSTTETYVPMIHTHAGNVIKLCHALVLFHPAPGNLLLLLLDPSPGPPPLTQFRIMFTMRCALLRAK